jgi:hypothetical protein
MKLTKETLKRIIKEELDEAMKFNDDGRSMDQVRFDTNLALTPPEDLESEEEPEEEPKGIQPGETISDFIFRRNIESGMDPKQAYDAAAAERPDLFYKSRRPNK